MAKIVLKVFPKLAETENVVEALPDRFAQAPAPELLDQIKRLGLLDSLPAKSSERDAIDLLESVCHGPPTDAQLKFAADLGFQLHNVAAMSAGWLDDLLKLSGQSPEQEDLRFVNSYGLNLYEGDGLATRVLVHLVCSLELKLPSDESDPLWMAKTCCVASADPEYGRPTLMGEQGIVTMCWPQAKLTEWISKRARTSTGAPVEMLLKLGHRAYWLPREDKTGLDGPFSRRAYHRRGQLVRLFFEELTNDAVTFREAETQERVQVPLAFIQENRVCSLEELDAHFRSESDRAPLVRRQEHRETNR